METLPSLINGESVTTGDTIDVLNPSTGELLAVVTACGAAEIDRAVKSARTTYDEEWSTWSAADRGAVLRRLGGLIRENLDELARLESLDTGKPLAQARSDVSVASRYFEFFGGIVEGFSSEYLGAAPDQVSFTINEPHGVVGHIVPWNYPIQVAARTVAPALAAGNCSVLKPAEETPLTALRLGQLALDAGLPAGVLNIVVGLGETAGAALASHAGVDFLSFTGSVEVGVQVAAAAAARVSPVALELGGKSPHVVFADADLDRAVPVIANSILQNAGQTCSAGSRLVVERSIHGELVRRLEVRFRDVKLGVGVDDPDLGPLVNAAQLDRVKGFVGEGREVGRLVCGGGIPQDPPHEGGFYFEPTIIDDVPLDARIANEEVFGPVLAVMEFGDGEVADALRIANATEYGLIAAVWTRDIDRALWLAKRIRAGQVFVNAYGVGGGIELPFGGFGKSGYGREKGTDGLRAYTRSKTVAVRVGEPA